MTDFNTTDFTARGDVITALMQWAMKPAHEGTPDTLRQDVLTAITNNDIISTVSIVQKIWDAGNAIDPELMVIGARAIMFIDKYGLHGNGLTSDAMGVRAGLLRDAGVQGNWPEVSEDPAREATKPAPVMPMMPGAITPEMAMAALAAAGMTPEQVIAQMQAEVDASQAPQPGSTE